MERPRPVEKTAPTQEAAPPFNGGPIARSPLPSPRFVPATRPATPMRDIQVKVLLSAEEYMALQGMCAATGEGHSGLLRRLLLEHTRKVAERMSGYRGLSLSRPEDGQD